MSALDEKSISNVQLGKRHKTRSSLGIGVTTLVTIMVVLLMASFSVLSLVSANSDLGLSQMATKSAEDYYQADGDATEWYARLDAFVGTISGSANGFENALTDAGYQVNKTDAGELRVFKSFAMGTDRQLDVTVEILDNRTTVIRQWQT